MVAHELPTSDSTGRPADGRRKRRTAAALRPTPACVSGALFVVAALAAWTLTPDTHPLRPGIAACSLLAFAATEYFLQPLGVAYATQLPFVVMLFALPLNAVPACVGAAALAVAAARRRTPREMLCAVGDGWFSVAPVLVLALAGHEGHVSWSDSPTYVAAFCAGWLSDAALVCVRRSFRGQPVRALSDFATPVALTVCCTPVGLAAATYADTNPAAAIAVLSGALGMMLLWGRERDQRLREARRALHDPLTGVANRELFFAHVDASVKRCERHDATGVIILLDLDFFKRVNDAHGHQCGDAVLRAFAARLGACVRECDTVARLGGDEFAVLLAEPAGREALSAVISKLRRQLAAPLRLDEGELISVSASIGAAVFDGGHDVEQVFATADKALYADKRSRHLRRSALPSPVATGRFHAARAQSSLPTN